jgi:hypothetical protein
VRAFVAVSEKTTKNNLGNDEETQYHHVFMKMLENAEGIAIESIKAGEYHRLELSCDLSETNVEEMSDLEVVMWLQDYTTKEVFNSNFAYDYTEHCYPVVNLTASIGGGDVQKLYLNWDAPEERTPIAYNIYVDGMLLEENYNLDTYYSNEEIVDIIMPFEYRGHTAEVVAVYEGGMTSVGTIKLIDDDWDGVEETEKVAFNIYPNPAEDFVKLSAVSCQLSAIKIYNCLGIMVEEMEVNSSEVEVNTSNYETGIYFINIEGKDFVRTERLIIL